MIINSVRFRFRPKVIDAYHFAKTMHAGQVDKAGNDYFTTIKLLLQLDLVLAHYWCRDKCVCSSLSSSNQSTSGRMDFT